MRRLLESFARLIGNRALRLRFRASRSILARLRTAGWKPAATTASPSAFADSHLRDPEIRRATVNACKGQSAVAASARQVGNLPLQQPRRPPSRTRSSGILKIRRATVNPCRGQPPVAAAARQVGNLPLQQHRRPPSRTRSSGIAEHPPNDVNPLYGSTTFPRAPHGRLETCRYNRLAVRLRGLACLGSPTIRRATEPVAAINHMNASPCLGECTASPDPIALPSGPAVN
jgi:hypothetical protein